MTSEYRRSLRCPAWACSASALTMFIALTLGGCPADADLASTLGDIGVGITSGDDGSGVGDDSTGGELPHIAGEADTGSENGSDSGDGPSSGNVELPPDMLFAVAPTDGPPDLTVQAYVFTVNGDPLPDGIYEWSFDDEIVAGPMKPHTEVSHTFQIGGLHLVRLSLTLAGVTWSIGCAQPPGHTVEAGRVTVWPTIAGMVYDAEGNPVADVRIEVQGTDLSATTDAGGRYAISVPYESSGVLVPTLEGYQFAPQAWSFSKLTSDLDGVDFRASSSSALAENHPPVALDQALDTPEDASASVGLVGQDADDDPLTYIITTLPEHGTLRDEQTEQVIAASELPYALSAAGNRVAYDPEANYNGADSFAFRVSDGTQESGPESATVTLTIAAVNDPPTFVPPPDQVMSMGPTLVISMGSVSPGPADEAGQTITFAGASYNQAIIPNENLVFSGSQLSITAVAAGGPVTIGVVAHDNGGNENGGQDASWATFSVTVVAGPLVSGTLTSPPTIGANPPIGPVELRLVGTGSSSGMDFTATTDPYGNYSLVVPSGWIGSVAAADPDGVYLSPPVIVLSEPVTEPLTGQDFTAWRPPIGIPAPSFGIQETHYMYVGATYDFGHGPEPYQDAGDGPYTHYVDNSQGNATDVDNPFGTRVLPRRTIPANVAAGSVVEIHGGPYTGPFIVRAVGTPGQPVFYRGDPPDRTDSDVKLEVLGAAQYVIVENIRIRTNELTSGINVVSAHHIALRNCEVTNTRSGILIYGQTAETPVHDVVVYNCLVHDNGIWQPDQAQGDRDYHALVVQSYAHDLWILDSTMFHVEGDGLQINAGNDDRLPDTNHIYVGRNHVYENKQAGLWTKQAEDVIFSQNHVHGQRKSSSAYGAGIGFQYAPRNVWILANEIHDCEVGLGMSGNQGVENDGHYAIGNLIYNIHAFTEGTYVPNDSYHLGQGVVCWHWGQKYFINNTFYDCDGGIGYARQQGVICVNNIFSQMTAGTHSLNLQEPDGAALSTVRNNLFYGPFSIRWGGSTTYGTLSAFQAATGQGQACLVADPLFLQPGSDFQTEGGSPAVNAGIAHEVYNTFLSAYGIDIAVGQLRNPRPLGNAYDMGAYEQ